MVYQVARIEYIPEKTAGSGWVWWMDPSGWTWRERFLVSSPNAGMTRPNIAAAAKTPATAPCKVAFLYCFLLSVADVVTLLKSGKSF